MLLQFEEKDFWQKLARRVPAGETPAEIVRAVETVLSDVRALGDRAVADHTERVEGLKLSPEHFRISESEIDAAVEALAPDKRKAIEDAIASVEAFHKRGLPSNWTAENGHGGTVGERFYPINRVGLYIPGGQVPLVSTVVMASTPARLAGCPSICACTPAGKDGSVSADLLAAFGLCGVREIYRLGGPMAIGALAYGTDTIPAVDKVFGPGAAFTNEAKRQVLGTIGIDILAGPSEVMIIADETARPEWVAIDLLAQAEHGTGREKLFLSVPSKEFYRQVLREIDDLIATLRHEKAIRTVLDKGFTTIICPELEQAAKVADYLAPEHLELQVKTGREDLLLETITTAGAIFIGHETPTVLGDFAAGPNHTLPTLRSGRFYSGLQTIDFMRRSSLVRYNRSSGSQAAHIVRAFAEMEHLDAHGKSLEMRLK